MRKNGDSCSSVKSFAKVAILGLPAGVHGGLIPIVVKNPAESASEAVRLVALAPQPRIIRLEMATSNKQKALVGRPEKTAAHWVFRPRIGTWLRLFAALLGYAPPDEHAWVPTSQGPNRQ